VAAALRDIHADRRREGQTDMQTDITKLICAFQDYANVQVNNNLHRNSFLSHGRRMQSREI
jgi:hypothetical protein